MQSRFLVFEMAALREANGTRFAGLGALRLPGFRPLGRANQWLLTRRLGQHAIAERVQSR